MKSRLVEYSKVSDQHGMSVPNNKSDIQSPAVVGLANPKREDEVKVDVVVFDDEDEKGGGKNCDSDNQPDYATSLPAASKAATQGSPVGPGDRYVTEVRSQRTTGVPRLRRVGSLSRRGVRVERHVQ